MTTKIKSGFLVINGMIILTTLSACGLGLSPEPTVDASALITSVAETVQAELSQTAAALPTSTNTPVPTVTSTPTITNTPIALTSITIPAPSTGRTSTGVIADDAEFEADVTIPDNTIVSPGEEFLKTWRILNTGSTTWNTTYQLVYADGIALSDYEDVIVEPIVDLPDAIAPNESAEVSVRIVAPTRNGTYRIYYRLLNPQGNFFGEILYLIIIVNDGSATVVPSATP
jgi:hypothetical protein